MKQRHVQDYDLLREKISALLDDELSGLDQEKLLKMVSQDKQLADVWQRYHVIGASCRREPVSVSSGLRQCVSRLIRHESPKAVATHSRRSVYFHGMKTWMPAGAVALTAVIAVLFGLYVTHEERVPKNIHESSIAAAGGYTRWVNTNPEHEDQLNAFLVNHGEFTPMSGLNGLISYAKFVSYDEK